MRSHVEARITHVLELDEEENAVVYNALAATLHGDTPILADRERDILQSFLVESDNATDKAMKLREHINSLSYGPGEMDGDPWVEPVSGAQRIARARVARAKKNNLTASN